MYTTGSKLKTVYYLNCASLQDQCTAFYFMPNVTMEILHCHLDYFLVNEISMVLFVEKPRMT